MSEFVIKGKAFLLLNPDGALINNIDTDMIFHNKWLHVTKLEEMGQYALGNLKGFEDFPKRVQPGLWVVAGRNFGAGSSRQQAVDCFRALGCVGVIAVSVAPIYLRNAINAGLPIAQVPELAGAVQAGDELTLDMEASTLSIARTGTVISADPPISSVQREIFTAGGLMKLG
jgi:3-isopropylmalate/(R)-2-methylmalate dehydratase small subunit